LAVPPKKQTLSLGAAPLALRVPRETLGNRKKKENAK
jgi:hypothetical protein